MAFTAIVSGGRKKATNMRQLIMEGHVLKKLMKCNKEKEKRFKKTRTVTKIEQRLQGTLPKKMIENKRKRNGELVAHCK